MHIGSCSCVYLLYQCIQNLGSTICHRFFQQSKARLNPASQNIHFIFPLWNDISGMDLFRFQPILFNDGIMGDPLVVGHVNLVVITDTAILVSYI